jgi:hypothetical protein
MASSQPASSGPFWLQKDDPSGLGATHVCADSEFRQFCVKIDEAGALINQDGNDSPVGAVEDSASLCIGSSGGRRPSSRKPMIYSEVPQAMDGRPANQAPTCLIRRSRVRTRAGLGVD